MAKAKKTKPTDARDDAKEGSTKGQAGEQAEAPASNEVAPQGVAPPDNGELLQQMWAAQVRALLAILNTTEPVAIPAATLATIQRFLSDNNVNAETVERRQRELERMQTISTDFTGGQPYDPADPDGRKYFEAQRR